MKKKKKKKRAQIKSRPIRPNIPNRVIEDSSEDIEELQSKPKRPVKKKPIKPKKKKKSFIGKLLKFCFYVSFTILIVFLSFKAIVFNKLIKNMINNTPSTVYDSNKNIIAQIGNERIRNNIKYDDIPSNLVNAYISIEDKRFYKHHGVDIKRTGGAILTYITHRGSSSFGGSTITQQLVKNLTGDDSTTITRKVKEWFYAICMEFNYSKEQILETYFNIIYTGPNIYGIDQAAIYYFDKDVKDLDLAECAFLAGLNNSPNSYNPFSSVDNSARIKKRTKIVLKQMLELKYISQSEYDDAVSKVESGLKFKNGKTSNNFKTYSYNTDALINEVIADLSQKKHIPKEFASNFFILSGSNIYSTENPKIQKILEQETQKNKYILKSENGTDTSQAAIVVINHSNGYVVASSGGLGEKNASRSLNRVTQMKRQTGSAMKPIAILAPAIDRKIVTPTTLIDDSPTTFTDYTGKLYTPIDYDSCKGTITLRQAVETSQNIPFVKIIEQLTPQVSIKYLKKMGITSLNNNDVNLSLSLGGLDEGISPLEFAAAYSTIANDGIYIEPTFYSKITSFDNETVLNSSQKRRRVFSKDVACVLKQLLLEPVNGENGTATYCRIPNFDVAAKTGTTNDNYDRWLCGFTTYYTSVCWYGFDKNEPINFNGQNPAGLIWSEVMKSIHSTLPPTRFEITNGVISRKVCKDSGQLANPKCKNTYTEYYLKSTNLETCAMH